ncbi:putative chitinase 3, partial [Orchesella cincta]
PSSQYRKPLKNLKMARHLLTHLGLLLLSCLSVSNSQEQCPPEGVTFLPHPDCTKYVICDQGQDFLMDCPPDLYYNVEIQQCDFPENVPECVGGTRPPVGGSTVTTSRTTATQEPPTSTDTPITNRTTTTSEPSTTTPPTTTSSSTVDPPTTPEPEPGALPLWRYHNCRLRKDRLQTYDKDELCSFVIRVANHSSILFRLESHGINETNAINIFTFSETGQIDSVHMGPPNPLTEAYVSGAIAVVVFRTKGNGGQGFSLSFQGLGSTAHSKGVEMVLSNVTGGEMTVPDWTNYSGTTNVIVLTAGHKFVDGYFKVLKLTISEEHFYTCGSGEHLFIFCNEQFHRSIYQTQGLLIVIFRKFYDGAWGSAKLTWNVVDS